MIEYLAGFFDGEGTIGVYRYSYPKAGRMTKLRVAVAGTNRTPLDIFASTLGGHVTYHNPKGIGKRPQWVWQAYGSVAKAALFRLEPHLIVKRSEAVKAMSFPIPNGSRNCSVGDRKIREEIAGWFTALKRNNRPRVAV